MKKRSFIPHPSSLILPAWSGRRDSNSRPSAWKADALPTELHPPINDCGFRNWDCGVAFNFKSAIRNPKSEIHIPMVQGAGFEPA